LTPKRPLRRPRAAALAKRRAGASAAHNSSARGTLLFDLAILVQTAEVVFLGKGAR
jgi:hypothetical protein